MFKQPPPAPTASAVGPCPTLIQTSRTPRTWKFIHTILITVGQGPIALAVGAGGGWFGHFYSHLSFLLFLPLFRRRLDID